MAFCPSSSLKLAKGATAIGKYPEMRDGGVTVGVGTDGVSAAGNMNLMRQMYLVAGLFKDARLDATQIGAREALRMATIDGARALGWDHEIGSLEPGKRADFVLFDLDHFEWTPYDDPLQALVWSVSPASIAETWVDGRPLYRDGARRHDRRARAARRGARARRRDRAARRARPRGDARHDHALRLMLGPVVLPGRAGVHELELEAGRVRAIRPSAAASGRLALPAFADLHVHADRAFARGPRPPRSLADAIALVAEIKRSCTEELVRERALRGSSGAPLAHGSLRVRTHVDVDELVEERALRGVARGAGGARRAPRRGDRRVRDRVDTDPASADGERRLRAALEAGADLLGAVPAFHPDPTRVGRAAPRSRRRVRGGRRPPSRRDGRSLGLPARAARRRDARTRARGSRHGEPLLCARERRARHGPQRTIAKVAAAGITVIALPALNLYLEDRGEATPRLRGITLVRELVEAGVPVRFGSDNVGDVFYPYGDADPLEAAWLAALAAHVDDEDVLLAGVCGGRTRIEEGDPADLVLVEADSVRDALARRPGGRTVVRAGEVVSAASRYSARRLRPHCALARPRRPRPGTSRRR